MKRTVGIIYGFGEGPRHAKRLYDALWSKGFIVVDKAERAEVIIAHSGGNFMFPKNTADKIIIMMNPSCSPIHQILIVFTKKMFVEFTQSVKNRCVRRWLAKAMLNIWYIATRIPYNLRVVMHGLRASEWLPTITAARVWVVTTHHDPWAALVKQEETQRLPQYTYLGHAGSHDSLWLQPEICADIVQSAYGTHVLATTRSR
ncbi:MAG TPA: hypothetical protein VLF43_03450 [Candidatus Saccharimonadales bacterium]|nr:hypothetical protein [Candidatus Saccharimonadales bacterium]